MKTPITLFTLSLILILSGAHASSGAVTYECEVRKKLNRKITYPQDNLDQNKYSVVIIDTGDKFVLKRCSFARSKGKITCDEYPGDQRETTYIDGVPRPYKKYYYFRGQFDVQIFPDLSFIENNGRGDIAFGICRTL